MEWQLNTAWILKIFVVPGALWIGYAFGFWAAVKLGRGDDIAPTYIVLCTVPLALIAAAALTYWLVGQQAFIIGVIVTFAALYGSTRWRSYKRRKSKVP
jgi:fatty acid desaturase